MNCKCISCYENFQKDIVYLIRRRRGLVFMRAKCGYDSVSGEQGGDASGRTARMTFGLKRCGYADIGFGGRRGPEHR